MSEIHAFSILGRLIRTWRKDIAAAQLADWIYSRGAAGMSLSDAAAIYAAGEMSLGAAYLRLERALPFEVDGSLYFIATDRGQKIIKQIAGRLESCPLERAARTTARPKLAAIVNEAVDKRLSELDGFVNLYALRQEAWRYMQSVEARLEARIAALEDKEAKL